jgi:hypothetical protein
MPQPITDLPAGYTEVEHLVVTDEKRLLWLNVLALIPLVISAAAMFGWWVLILRLRSGRPGELVWWAGLLIVVAVLPLHEGLHAAAIRWTGHKPRFGAKLDKGVLYATADGALFRRAEFIVIALAPIVVITLVGMALMVVLPDWPAFWVGVAVIVNASSAVGDLWMVAVVRRYAGDALVRDEADGIRVFTPLPQALR